MFRAIFTSRISLLILGLVVVWVGTMAGKEFNKRYRLQQQIDVIHTEVTQLEKENRDLAELIQSFQDEGVVELEARRRLNVKKPGEEVVVVLPGNEEEVIAQNEEIYKSKNAAKKSDEEDSKLDIFVRRAVQWWEFVF